MTTTREVPQNFPHTRWSVVLAATQGPLPEATAALETICSAYWYPLYSYVRRCGKSPHDAQDLTQEFFQRLLEKRWLNDADRNKGRLRTFLITALKNFMSNKWRHASAQRRGGTALHVQIDADFVESRYAADPAARLPADEAFDRQWAILLLDRTIERLRLEFITAGKAKDFDTLKSSLAAARGEIDYAAMAAQLGANEGAVRVAVHRLRKRFREIYRDEISQTLPDGADLDSELHHLAAVLGRE